MNNYSERTKQINSKSKPSFASNSLNSPYSFEKLKAKYGNYFEKLNSVNQKCERVQREVRRTYKEASMKMKKNLKNLETLNYTGDDNDEKWKQQLEIYNAKKEKNSKAYHKIKAMSFPDLLVKEPIKRMKVKNEFYVPERARISISEVYSSAGKLILSNNKRNFGQVRESGNRGSVKMSQKKGKNNFLLTENRKSSIFKPLNGEKKLLDRVKNLPKLAKQIKDAKIKSIL